MKATMIRTLLAVAACVAARPAWAQSEDFTCPPPGNSSEADCTIHPKADGTFVVTGTHKGQASISLDMKNGDKPCNAKAGKKYPFSGSPQTLTDTCVLKVKADEIVQFSAVSTNENATAIAIKLAVRRR